MFINCPYCSQLVATDPVHDLPPTHCPHCDSLLRRDEHAPDDASEAPDALDFNELMKPQPLETIVAAPEVETGASDSDLPAPTVVVDDPTTPVATPAVVATTPTRSVAGALRRLPSFARDHAQAPQRARDTGLIAAAVALAFLLLLQLLLADRARLAANAQWRPLLSALCTALRCDLPPWREPAAFTLLQRDVRQHPTIPGALRVSATFRNDARWSQPWPRLQLTLSDANGRPAGERSFEARDYLGGAPSQPELAHGESATVAMDIMEPAAQIVAYDFKFR